MYRCIIIFREFFGCTAVTCQSQRSPLVPTAYRYRVVGVACSVMMVITE